MLEAGETLVLTADAQESDERLDQWLSGRIPEWSRTRIQALIREGCVEADGRSDWRPRDRVVAGAAYRVRLPAPTPVDVQPEDIPLDVLYEDSDLIVLNKPPGLVVHPAPGHADGTLVNALLFKCDDLQGVGGEQRPGIIHRLDRDTSGVMVVAKNQVAMDSLAAQFQDRRVHKAYVAVVAGIPNPSAGRIETLIGRSRTDRKKMSATPALGKPAVTNYRLVEVLGGFALVRLLIETGRTHQIRVQMAHIGCPVAGDAVYGSSRKQQWQAVGGCERQMLHAETLSFIHPSSGNRVEFSAPIPPDMSEFIARLRASSA
jgi:23S rRNA pseudouridine1911/1915/1917 synthase